MRGARGLLISITGGPDLTLYEVDEAATRIREEVDPEANIILGATFDESLEGTMRVSVVATGLAAEISQETKPDSEAQAEDQQSSRTVFGFTGKQNTSMKKPIQPAPMAARAAPQPAVGAQPKPQPAIEAAAGAEDDHEAYSAVTPAVRQPQVRAPRIPSIEEFPAIAQQQVEAQKNRIEQIAEHSARKRRGLFDRLASVGLGRKDDPAPAQREPSMTMQAQPRPQPAPVRTPPLSALVDPSLDDDQLEIPAFLRRQAN